MFPSSPAKLGRYEILEEIGKGAMGVVYLARDPLIGRQVALKTFRVGLSVRDAELDQFRQRFMREAQSAGILSHPNIVTIHDVVESGDEGLAFIAMEYVRGTNLKSVMQDGRTLTLAYVADIIGQIAEGLEYAHTSKVVHRDVKPANILITTDGRVKITDFGIARLDTSNLTQEGQLLGTPNYMSPEQILGREIDHRADIFSLGVVLYELLTRHKPFQGDNLTVVSHRIVYDSFTPLREYVRELPPEIERILQRSLEKDPARRFQRAREMGEELKKAVGVPATAEALNETQGLSMTVVMPSTAAREEATSALSSSSPSVSTLGLPPLPPPPGAAVPPAPPGGNALDGTQPGTLPPVPGDRTGTSTAAPVHGPGRRGGLSAVLVAGLLLLILLGLGAAGLWWWRGRSQPEVAAVAPTITAPVAPMDVAAQKARAQLLGQQGQEKLGMGDYASAVALLTEARQLDPERADLAQLLARAQLFQNQRAQQSGQQLTFAAKLAEAKLAYDTKRFDDADAAVAAALQLQPQDPDALRLLAAVRAGRTQQRRERLAQQQSQRGNTAKEPSSAPGEPAVPVAIPAEAPAEVTGRPALLQVSFSSQMPEGMVMIWVNGKSVVREPFRYIEGGRFRARPATGSFRRQYEVPVGNNEVRILVTPKGQAGRGKNIAGNFPGGRVRNLEVSLTQTGEMQANLN